MFSILILTQDEERNIAECLDAIAFCDDIWVLDSGSTDKTVEIAEARGCHILRRKFDNFGDQRNYAIDNAKFKYEWVFDLDADERFTAALREECEQVIAKDELSAYYCSYKNMLWGKWIKHSTGFPVYQMRLHKLGEIRFVANGHGQKEGAAKRGIGYLKEPYIHYDYSKGLAAWCAKHVDYARREALMRIEQERGLAAADSGDAKLRRRRRIKQLVNKLPCKPLLRFFFAYFVHLGFLDGLAGLQYARMQMWYQFAIDSIYRDLKSSSKAESKTK